MRPICSSFREWKKVSETPLKRRRQPVQSRSKMTQTAILEAFVRLLLEQGYARLTIRDIAAVAGVGLGTVYEHFPGKKSIAANCIHQRFKSVGVPMLDRIETMRGQPLAAIADALMDTMVQQHTDKPREWSALIFLERQISDEAAYQSLYRHFVEIWIQAIGASTPAVSAAAAQEMAEVLHAAVYGLLYQSLMSRPLEVGQPAFRRQMGELVQGYLLARQGTAG